MTKRLALIGLALLAIAWLWKLTRREVLNYLGLEYKYR